MLGESPIEYHMANKTLLGNGAGEPFEEIEPAPVTMIPSFFARLVGQDN